MPDDHLNHPADHIDHAQAMLRFLSSALGDSSPCCHLAERDLEGLCYILGHIEDTLSAALTKL